MEPEIQYLNAIILPLIAYPDNLRIVRTVDTLGILLEVILHKDDMGRVIGKNGETARAIRKIVRQYGMTNEAHIAIKINEPTV